MATNDGNSLTHGPHQAAHTFIKYSLSELFASRSLMPETPMVSRTTDCRAHSLSASTVCDSFSFHFIAQPNTFVVFTGTSLPASKASIAFLASMVAGV